MHTDEHAITTALENVTQKINELITELNEQGAGAFRNGEYHAADQLLDRVM